MEGPLLRDDPGVRGHILIATHFKLALSRFIPSFRDILATLKTSILEEKSRVAL
jgi:hypothetical protein